MIRLTFLLPNGPHVLLDPQPAAGCVIEDNGKVRQFDHGMVVTVRKATQDEIEEWRQQAC